MRLVEIVTFPDSRHASYSNSTQSDYVGSSHVINVWCNPSPIEKFPKMTASLMVASNKNCKVGGFGSATVVGMEVANLSIFNRTRHHGQIRGVPNCLGFSAMVK